MSENVLISWQFGPHDKNGNLINLTYDFVFMILNICKEVSLGRDESRILASSEMELTDNISDVAGFLDMVVISVYGNACIIHT